MAVVQLPPSESHKVQPTKRRRKHHPQNPKPKQQQPQHPPSSPTPSSWDQIKNLLKCKQMDINGSDPNPQPDPVKNNNNGYSKLSSCSSICSFRDVANGNTRIVHRPDNSPETSTHVVKESGMVRRKKHVGNGVSSSPSSNNNNNVGSGKSNGHGSYTLASRGMQLRKLSGCYECHAIVDPARNVIARSTICICSECGEVFPKIESLEHHQAVRHAGCWAGVTNWSPVLVKRFHRSRSFHESV